jgi:uncharacterized protein (TIGR02145 family)
MRALITILLVFILVQMQAQPFQMGFTGSGLSSSVDSVEVLNMIQGTTLTIPGSDILELVTNIGISEEAITMGRLHVYPNPVENECRIEFCNHQTDVVSITLYDGTGKLLLQKEDFLAAGNHAYSLDALRNGLFVFKITTPSQTYSQRIISTGTAKGLPDLKYIGMISEIPPHARKAALAGTTQMQYNAGEMLLLKGFSGGMGRVLTMIPNKNWIVNFEFDHCTDGDGNHYPIVTIGNQTWMAENLRTTRYRNGIVIPNEQNDSVWASLTTGALCYYFNDSAYYASRYGALYNAFAFLDSNGLCPAGWHVPTDLEWKEMEIFLGMDPNIIPLLDCRGTDEGTRLKDAGTANWMNPPIPGNNSTGFTALPGGVRSATESNYTRMGLYGYWWTSSESNPSLSSYGRYLSNSHSGVCRYSPANKAGLSVRCIQD